ncbi:MAG: hypothetical protein IT193_06050 [Propionibacteriaceae bacterium]|nr:hypothetical protein [Propionibacteriaceae bacterium]
MAGLVRPTFVASLYGREHLASISGAMSTFVTGSTAIAPVGAGVAYDLLGSYDPLFWGFVMLSASAAAVVLVVRESAGHSESEPSPTAHPIPASDRAG